MADLPSVNPAEIQACTKVARSNADGPVFMLNLNKYRAEAHYPDGRLYSDYMRILETLLAHGELGVGLDGDPSARGRAARRTRRP